MGVKGNAFLKLMSDGFTNGANLATSVRMDLMDEASGAAQMDNSFQMESLREQVS